MIVNWITIYLNAWTELLSMKIYNLKRINYTPFQVLYQRTFSKTIHTDLKRENHLSFSSSLHKTQIKKNRFTTVNSLFTSLIRKLNYFVGEEEEKPWREHFEWTTKVCLILIIIILMQCIDVFITIYSSCKQYLPFQNWFLVN